ncbi:dienelactone hydrolase, partial [Podospora aff. communis PSN243]
NPPAACCVTGHEHSGTPTGTFIQLPNTTITAYLTIPPTTPPTTQTTTTHPTTKAILFIPDVLGLWPNNLLLADRFASETGHLVLLPDIYTSDPFKLHKPFSLIEPTDDLVTDWAARGSDGKSPHTPAQIDPIVDASITYLRAVHSVARLGAVGYCLGAKYLVRFLDTTKGKIDVGFVAHPSFVTEEELWASRGPLSVAAAEGDLIFTKELRHKTEEILKKKGEVWSIGLLGGVAHGFAVRGHPESTLDEWAKEEALGMAVRFFGTWL